jgi:hypothetical protein
VVRSTVKASISRPGLDSNRSDLALKASALLPVLAEAERCSMTTRLTATHRGSPRPSWARLSELGATKWQQSVMAARRRLGKRSGLGQRSGLEKSSGAASQAGLAVLVLPASPLL